MSGMCMQLRHHVGFRRWAFLSLSLLMPLFGLVLPGAVRAQDNAAGLTGL